MRKSTKPGRDEKFEQNRSLKFRREEICLETSARWGSNFKISGKVVVHVDVDRICVARRRNRCQDLTNTRNNFQVP